MWTIWTKFIALAKVIEEIGDVIRPASCFRSHFFAMCICAWRRPRQQFVICSTEMGRERGMCLTRTSVADVAISAPQAHWKAPGQGLKIRFLRVWFWVLQFGHSLWILRICHASGWHKIFHGGGILKMLSADGIKNPQELNMPSFSAGW